MRVGVFYHQDFAERGYITLRHRVKPAYDALCKQEYARRLKFFEPSISQLHHDLLNQTHTERHIETVKAEGFHEVALLSAAGVVSAAEMLATDQLIKRSIKILNNHSLTIPACGFSSKIGASILVQ